MNGINFYKIRAFFVIYIIKFFAFILGVEMPPIVSTTAIIEDKGKILFLKLSYLDGYGLPGGIIKSGETINEALKREVYEETGLKVTSAIFFNSYYSKFRGLNTLSLVYKVKAKGKIKSSDEGELYWLKPNDLIGKFAYKNTDKIIIDYLKNE